MKILKQSTATTLLLGPFVDETDGKTAETALTISQADVLLWKEGGTTLAQKTEATSCTHRSNGLYTCPIDATDTDTLGILTAAVHEAGALPVRHDYFVLPANAYDALKAGSGVGLRADVQGWLGTAPATPTTNGVPEVDLTHIAGAAVSTTTAQLGVNVVAISTDATAADNLEAAYDGAGYAGGTIPQQVILTSSGNAAVADAVLDENVTGHIAANSLGAVLQPSHSGACQAGGSGTTVVLAAGASASDDYYNGDQIFGWVTADRTNFFADYITAYTGATRTATVTGIPVSPDATYTYVVLPGGTIPGASAPTAAQNADAVLDELLADHVTSGSLGQLLSFLKIRTATAQAGAASTITLDASASATNDIYNYNLVTILSGDGAGQTRQITDYVGASKVATVNLAWTTNPSSNSVFCILPGGLDAATVASIADAIWDEARSGHATAGTFGEQVFADVIRISSDATAADNAEAFFDGTGYAGTNNVIPSVTTVTGNVNGNVAGSVGSVTGAVGSVTGAVGSVTGAVASVTGAVGSVTGNVGGNVTGSVGSLAAQAKADVNAEVVDALDVDTYAQPGQGTPAATNTIRTMLSYLFKAWRNRTDQTATEYRLFNDDAATVDQKATASDNGTTASRGEVATGP